MGSYFQILAYQPVGQTGLALQPCGPKFPTLEDARAAKKRLVLKKGNPPWDMILLDGQTITKYHDGPIEAVRIQQFWE